MQAPSNERISFCLKELATAAAIQGEAPYDHAAALRDAGVIERGDELSPIAMLWAGALPHPHKTLQDYITANCPTGEDMEHVFIVALDSHRKNTKTD